jgi:hypothetical protein
MFERGALRATHDMRPETREFWKRIAGETAPAAEAPSGEPGRERTGRRALLERMYADTERMASVARRETPGDHAPPASDRPAPIRMPPVALVRDPAAERALLERIKIEVVPDVVRIAPRREAARSDSVTPMPDPPVVVRAPPAAPSRPAAKKPRHAGVTEPSVHTPASRRTYRSHIEERLGRDERRPEHAERSPGRRPDWARLALHEAPAGHTQPDHLRTSMKHKKERGARAPKPDPFTPSGGG